jgi:acyl-CoA thioesterase-1
MLITNKFLTLYLTGLVLLCGCNQSDTTNHLEAETVADAPQAKKNKSERPKTILFFGNSLTAGYGLEPDQAFPALIQERLDSLDMPYKVINAGVSGETSAGGKSRIDWLLKQPVDVFVLELGANDGLRGINPEETYKNLQAIIQKVRAKNPGVQIILAGMQLPPNMGSKYAKEFKEVYTRLKVDEQVALIPFLLKDVGGVPKLNQADGIHPTAEGEKIVVENVWPVLDSVLTVMK